MTHIPALGSTAKLCLHLFDELQGEVDVLLHGLDLGQVHILDPCLPIFLVPEEPRARACCISNDSLLKQTVELSLNSCRNASGGFYFLRDIVEALR